MPYTAAIAAAYNSLQLLMPVESAIRLCLHRRDMNDDTGLICVLGWTLACWVIAKNVRTHFPETRMNVPTLPLPPDTLSAGDQTWKALHPCKIQ